MRIQVPVALLEFEEDGDTIWVHSPKGATVMRIKSWKGITTSKECDNAVSHTDIMVEGPIHICVTHENSGGEDGGGKTTK